MTRHSSQSTLLVAALLLAGLVLAGAGLVAAGDSIAIYEFPDDEGYEASAGDTVELDLYMQSDGGYSGEGLQSSEATVAVNDSVASITDIDHGPWIRAENDSVDVDRETTIDGGTATVQHNRTPPGDGAVGYDRFFTMTIELDEDVPPSDVVVDVTDARAVLINGFPIRTIELETTIAVDGGGDRIEPAVAEANDSDGTDDVAVTTASETDRTVTPSDEAGEPPILLAAVVGGLGAALIVAGVVTWLRRP